MQQRIIGIAGTNGSGKDTVGKMLALYYNFLFISVTDLLRAELAHQGLEPSREHMRNLSAEWRRQHGLGVLVDKAYAEFSDVKDKYAGLAMASLRNPGEADSVHKLGGTVLWVDADPRARYDRLQRNLEHRGEVRAVDDRLSFKQFIENESEEMTRQPGADTATLAMIEVKDRSDAILINEGDDLDLLQAKLAEVLKLDE